MFPEPEVEFDLEFKVGQEGRSWGSIRHNCGTFTAVAGPSPRSQEFHPCKRAVVAGQSATFNSGSSPVGEAHSPSEAQWRRARGRGGGHREEHSGAHHVTTVDVRSPARHSTFQYALATKSGCESIAHALQGLSELNPRTTVTSIDGISAYDLISRQARLDGVKLIARGSAFGITVRINVLWESLKFSVGRCSWQGAHQLAG